MLLRCPAQFFWFKLLVLICDVDDGWPTEGITELCVLLMFDEEPDVEARNSVFLLS